MNDAVTTARRNRRLLIAIAAACAGPLLLAWLLTRGGLPWSPAGGAQHGELIDPPVPLLEALAPGDPARERLGGALSGHWTLVAPAPAGCAAPCRRALEALRAVQLAQGKRVIRVERLLLAPPGSALPATHAQAPYPRPRVVTLARPAIEAILTRAGATASPAGKAPPIVLVDYAGRMVMRYAPPLAYDGMIDDLRRLLRASRGR